MARIFNIYFTYEQVQYNAIVSVRTTPFFTEFTLNNFDERLFSELPGNKILSTNPGHYVFQSLESVTPTPLMAVIMQAVSDRNHTAKVDKNGR